MASLMENLIEVLGQECSEYEVLLTLSQKKTSIIVSGDLQELQKITDEEQEIVGRINQLDRKRSEVTADIANVLNKDVSTLTLSNLIVMLSARPTEQAALAQAHDRLTDTVRSLRTINEQNSELIANALDMVSFELNLLQAAKAAPETANYNKGAYNTGSCMGVTAGGFDARQ